MDRKAISWRSWLAGSCCWGGEEGRGCWLSMSYQGWGWLSEQLYWTAITLTDMRAALFRAVRILALAYTPRVLIPIVSEWTRRSYKQHLPLLIIDYWPASAESNIVSFNRSALGLTVAPIRVEREFSAVWRRAVRRQTHCFVFVFRFADVCWNALLGESLVIHGCSEEGALPRYGCRNQGPFFKKNAAC